MIRFFEKILYFLPYFILFMVCTLFFMMSFTAMEEATLLGKMSSFLVQNIPTAVLIVLMFLSKNRPKIGGTILIIIWAFFFFFFHAFQNLSLFFLIVPILISGLLFLFQDKLIQ